jgi:hypothetical protein
MEEKMLTNHLFFRIGCKPLYSTTELGSGKSWNYSDDRSPFSLSPYFYYTVYEQYMYKQYMCIRKSCYKMLNFNISSSVQYMFEPRP